MPFHRVAMLMWLIPASLAMPIATSNFTVFVPSVDGYRSVSGVDVKTTDIHSVKPASAQTGQSACNDDNTCWGFSHCQGPDDPPGGVAYLKSVVSNSGCTAYFSNTKAPTGYKALSGDDFMYDDIHHYKLPANLCGSTCDQDSDCVGFSVCGDDCYMKTLHGNGYCTAYIK